MLKMSSRSLTKIVLTALCLIILSACAGGGTSGTGDLRSITIEGRIVSESGEPLTGIEVADLRSGQAGVSNESGVYSFQTEAPVGEELKVLIHSDQVNETKSLGVLTEDALIVHAQIVVSTSSDTVTVTEITINPSTPSPTPSSEDETTGDNSQQQEDNGGEEAQKQPRSVQVLGKIISNDDAPLSGISVTLRGLGSRDISDENGQFELKALSDKTKLALRLRAESYDEEVEVRNIPAQGDIVIRITIRVVLPDLVGQDIIETDQMHSLPEITSLTVSRN